jgi:hypothetical protein
MKNGRCGIHGGKSTGPKTPEGLERSRKARWKHGGRSREAIRRRQEIGEFIRETNAVARDVLLRLSEQADDGAAGESEEGGKNL